MRTKFILSIYLTIAALCVSASGVTVETTLDGTAPPDNPVYRAETGTMTGERLSRNAVASTCGSPKASPGTNPPAENRQYDIYRFTALTSGCVTVTLSDAGDNVLFGVAYSADGLDTSNPETNYLADLGSSPIATIPSRAFSFDVVAGQIFHIVIHEVNAGGGIGQSYTLEVDGVKLTPDFSVTETLDATAPSSSPAFAVKGTTTQTGRLNRFSPASTCAAPKSNPGLFTPTGSRQADFYRFVPASSGCVIVTLSHTGSGGAQITAYDQVGFNAADPSLNYLADPGQSATNSTRTFSFLVNRGVPFDIAVSEVNPGASIGDSYTLNISGIKLYPKLKINGTLDATAPSTLVDYVNSTGVQTGRLNRFSPISTCDAPKPNPGLFTAADSRQYDLYTFTPTASGCVEVTLSSAVNNAFFSAAYSSIGFNPADPSANFIAAHSNSPTTANPSRTYSFNVTAGVPFSITVHEVNPGGGVGQNYALEIGGVPLNIAPRAAQFDYDGDARTDVSVFRPSNGAWYFNQSSFGFTGTTFGISTDLLAPADFDGDGKTDVAVFRPSNGAWYYLKSSDNSFVGLIFGQNGDLPRPADFDGDGKADINIFRPSNGGWYRLNSNGGSFSGTIFGMTGDRPLVADFDGDLKSDIAVFRPSAGTFYWFNSSDGSFQASAFGTSSDIPTMGDFDGDGKTDIAVFRPSNGAWYRFNSSDGSFAGVGFGQIGDIPVPGDYSGDGRADVAVFRSGNWYRLDSSFGSFSGEAFGFNTDTPTPGAF